jgi:hypothetical protein
MDVVDVVKKAPFWGKVSFPYFVNFLPTFKWILNEIWHKKWEVGPNGMGYSIAHGFFSHKNCGSWHVCDELCDFIYCDPSLGLATKVRACEGVGQEWSLKVTFHAPGSVGECEGMNPHIHK